MKDQKKNGQMDWAGEPNFPRPDYLSSSRKRLAPQLLFKGGILNSWKKKTVVVLNKSFFDTLPAMQTTEKSKADIAWIVYDLKRTEREGSERFELVKVDEIFTEFTSALMSITNPAPGKMEDFMKVLQEKLDAQLETPPTNKKIERPF